MHDLMKVIRKGHTDRSPARASSARDGTFSEMVQIAVITIGSYLPC